MSYSFKSLAETGVDIVGHDDVDEKGNPAGGYAVDRETGANIGVLYLDHMDDGLASIRVAGMKDDRFRISWQNGPVEPGAG